MTHECSDFKSAIAWPDFQDEIAPTGEWIPLSAAALKAVEAVAESVTMAAKTESPIETIFGSRFALALRSLCNDIGWKFSVGTGDDDLVLHPQFPLVRFRYDFAVVAKWKAKPLVLIECDGKDFHLSADQQANDKLKNDAASNAGIRLIRFTGSEINGDVSACVAYALSVMLKGAIQ